MRCCLMGCLLKMLSDMLQSPQPLYHIHICPKPKVKLGPIDLIYLVPPSSFDIAIARNPNQFGLTEMGLQTLYCLLQLFRSHQDKSIGPTEFARPTLYLAYYQNRSHRVCVIGHTEITMP